MSTLNVLMPVGLALLVALIAGIAWWLLDIGKQAKRNRRKHSAAAALSALALVGTGTFAVNATTQDAIMVDGNIINVSDQVTFDSAQELVDRVKDRADQGDFDYLTDQEVGSFEENRFHAYDAEAGSFNFGPNPGLTEEHSADQVLETFVYALLTDSANAGANYEMRDALAKQRLYTASGAMSKAEYLEGSYIRRESAALDFLRSIDLENVYLHQLSHKYNTLGMKPGNDPSEMPEIIQFDNLPTMGLTLSIVTNDKQKTVMNMRIDCFFQPSIPVTEQKAKSYFKSIPKVQAKQQTYATSPSKPGQRPAPPVNKPGKKVYPPTTKTTVVTPPPSTKTTVVTPPPSTKTTVIQPPPTTKTTVIKPPTTKTTVVTPPPTTKTTVIKPPPTTKTTTVTPPPTTITTTVTKPCKCTEPETTTPTTKPETTEPETTKPETTTPKTTEPETTEPETTEPETTTPKTTEPETTEPETTTPTTKPETTEPETTEPETTRPETTTPKTTEPGKDPGKDPVNNGNAPKDEPTVTVENPEPEPPAVATSEMPDEVSNPAKPEPSKTPRDTDEEFHSDSDKDQDQSKEELTTPPNEGAETDNPVEGNFTPWFGEAPAEPKSDKPESYVNSHQEPAPADTETDHTSDLVTVEEGPSGPAQPMAASAQAFSAPPEQEYAPEVEEVAPAPVAAPIAVDPEPVAPPAPAVEVPVDVAPDPAPAPVAEAPVQIAADPDPAPAPIEQAPAYVEPAPVAVDPAPAPIDPVPVAPEPDYSVSEEIGFVAPVVPESAPVDVVEAFSDPIPVVTEGEAFEGIDLMSFSTQTDSKNTLKGGLALMVLISIIGVAVWRRFN